VERTLEKSKAKEQVDKLEAEAGTDKPLRILCVACVIYGRPFMIEAKKRGHKIMVLTSKKQLDKAWPHESIEEVFAVDDFWDEKQVRNTVAYLARHRKIDRIVALGDYDVEVACMLREHMRIPGMGETTMRYFRDKLAMRMKAQEDGLPVPEFVHILNHDEVFQYMNRVAPPWIIKPRQEAASTGVKVMHDDQEVWKKIMELGDKQSGYLLEKYDPGDVFHVDAVVHDRKTVFRGISKYGKSMLDLNTEGGVYSTRFLDRKDPDWKALKDLNDKVIKSLGLVHGVTHIEYIKSKATGKFFFLEAGARVGAAKIPDVIYYATDICLWWEWAKLETQAQYELPKFREGYAGAVVCLARQQWPDMSAYDDPEVKWVQKKEHHAGIIVAADDPRRVEELVESYRERFARDFLAHVPRKD